MAIQSSHFVPGIVLCYPGYQRVFSRAAGIFGVGRRPKPRAAKKPETALEKSLAPRVFFASCSKVLDNLFSIRVTPFLF